MKLSILSGIRSHPRFALLLQFLRFGVVGGLGFVVDTATVYALRPFVGVVAAGLLAYPVAATFTWGVNRLWTFRGRDAGSAFQQWLRFLAANALGFALNRGIYVLLVTLVATIAENPVIATAAGAVAGMFVNFHLSRKHVFR
jgi:putative flippase GtrA